MRALTLVIAIIVLVGAVFLLTSGNNDNGQVNENPTADVTDINAGSSGSNASVSYDIKIDNFAFSIETLSIKRGDSVTWTNVESASHTITSDGNTELSSQPLSQGKSYTHKFRSQGTYAYHCAFHPEMKGKIIVS